MGKTRYTLFQLNFCPLGNRFQRLSRQNQHRPFEVRELRLCSSGNALIWFLLPLGQLYRPINPPLIGGFLLPLISRNSPKADIGKLHAGGNLRP